jgi:hypothetical protein
MKRLLRIGIASLAAAVVLFAASHYVRAQGTWPSNGASQTNDPSRHYTTLLKTYSTQAYVYPYIKYETGGEHLALDGVTTFECPVLDGCTLEIEVSVDVGDVDSPDNWWGPFVQVDGSWLSYSPPVGETPTDKSYVLVTSNLSTPVTFGKHKVQSFVYSYDGLYVCSYHINYRVFGH